MKINFNWDVIRKYVGNVLVLAGVAALIYVSSSALAHYLNNKKHPNIIKLPVNNKIESLIYNGVCYETTNSEYSLEVINGHVYDVERYYVKCDANLVPIEDDGNVYKVIDGQFYRLIVVIHEPTIVNHVDIDTTESMAI